MSKPIILDDIENKLEREWILLGETAITEEDITAAGDTGIMTIAVESEIVFNDFVELMGIVRIPYVTGLNSVDGSFRIGLSENINTIPSEYHGYIIGQYGYNDFKLSSTRYTDLIIRNFFLDGSNLYCDVTRDLYGGYKQTKASGISHVYTDNPAMGRVYYPCKSEGKTTYWFDSSMNSFKLPAYTVLEVYGR